MALMKGTDVLDKSGDAARRDVQNAVTEWEIRHRRLLEALPDLVFRLDAAGRHLDYYAPSEDRLFIPPERFVGRSVSEVLPANVAAIYLHEIGRVLESREAREFEYALTFAGNDSHLYHARMVPVSPDEVLALVRDVTTHRELEERVRRVELQLLQAQKMEAIGRLAGGVAHDFNNLLTVIIGSGEMLRDVVTDPSALSLIEEVLQASDRAAQLTQQLLAFGRRQLLKPEVMTLDDVVNGAERLLRRTLGEDVDLQVRLAPDPWTVKVDRAQTEQVVMNLAINARDAMPGGGPLVISTANVRTDGGEDIPSGEYVQLSVTDAGVGMTAEVRERLFEPFFTTKEQGKGTGLGLAMVYGIVKQSGGHIRIESDVGAGTAIRVFLPRVAADGATRDRAEARPAPGLPRGTGAILLVEDDPGVRALAATILRRCGYDILEAPTARLALDVLDRPDPLELRLMISDVVLPGMSGLDLAARVRQRWPSIPVLFISGYADDVLAKQQAVEAHRLLPKPFTPLELARAVQSAIDE